MSDKVMPRHLGRRAILYVRQSTQQQVLHNDESRRLQYAMRDRLELLGWQDVEVIDDDLGKSAAGHSQRPGFEHLLASVSMGEVGAVAAREVSRFARNSREWQRLLEVCRYVDTLLVDQDAVYDLRQSNDRLLLGLKGNLNEYELDLLRLRAHEARREKARRGEFICLLPVGYLKGDDGGIEKTPDRRVQQAIELVFSKFLELGSARQVLFWLCEQDLQIPRGRNDRGRVEWRKPTHGAVHSMLINPIYAGAYAYGRTEVRTSLIGDEPRKKLQRMPREQWKVLLPNAHDGYITWETFERIQKMLADNNIKLRRKELSPGAARKGEALLGGLIRCRRCGAKMCATYSGGSVPRYACQGGRQEYGDTRCMSFSGVDLDPRVAELVLEVVRPAAIEASLAAVERQQAGHDEATEALRLELQSARYDVDRAFRQYDAVDPANRLVADELERRWNIALERVRQLETRLNMRASTGPSPSPSAATFGELAKDLERLWQAPTTDMRLRKRLVRTLIEEIIADTDEATREIAAVIHWKGGVHTELRVRRRSRGSGCRTAADVVDAIRTLALVCDDRRIAQFLSKAGLRTAKGNTWSRDLVASLRHKRGIPTYVPSDTWINLSKAGELAGVDHHTLRRAIEQRQLQAEHPLPNGPWILRREDVLEWRDQRPTAAPGPSPAQRSLDLSST